jgi:hypothetical protein
MMDKYSSISNKISIRLKNRKLLYSSNSTAAETGIIRTTTPLRARYYSNSSSYYSCDITLHGAYERPRRVRVPTAPATV